jgi:GTPase SAR1 family protein
VAKPGPEVYQAHILNVVAIGGMGKSALTWKWFNDIAPQEMQPLAGRMWWSFYESDASFENFVTRALAYVTRRPREEAEKTSPPDRETQLLAALDREPFLIVLDGLERILIAYARMDAAHLSDDDLDQQTANRVAGAIGLPESAAQSFSGQHRFRKTADARAGGFLRDLAAVRASRILMSTRLYPADLQTGTGDPIPGSFALFLTGLADDDALGLWRKFTVTGSRDELLGLFRRFENHPLLIQALASEVASYRRAPGDFNRWRQANPGFDPFGVPLAQAKTHVLEFALQGLKEPARNVLNTLASLQRPVGYSAAAEILVGKGKPLSDESALDPVLNDLEDRGLLAWDRRRNQYDLHPIVRGVILSQLSYMGTVLQDTPLHEAKLLLVGEGNVGRTSLLGALRREPFVENRETTHGIQMGTLLVDHPDRALKITLNTWDFGGQEVYRITHQFFFSNKSLYLLVWRPREGREENAIESWLKRISLRARDAQVIIVATHCEERHAELDYPELKARFDNILVNCHEVDSRTGLGIAELEHTIALHAAKLPQMGMAFNRRWSDARRDLLALKEPQISRYQAEVICRNHQLSEDEAGNLLRLLHDLGLVIYYDEDDGLQDIVVLQPEWLTKAIGYVLEDKPTLESAGELDHTRLRIIWQDHRIPGRESYARKYHPYLLRLMEKFDISYRIQDEEKSLVAQLVSFQRPELPWEAASELLQGQRELGL